MCVLPKRYVCFEFLVAVMDVNGGVGVCRLSCGDNSAVTYEIWNEIKPNTSYAPICCSPACPESLVLSRPYPVVSLTT